MAALDGGNVELLALGDFQATNESAEVLPLDAERGTPLPFPLATRAVEARLAAGQQRFIGYAEQLKPNRFDVLLWPERESCELFRPDGEQGYPGKGGGQALGFSLAHGLLLAAGGNDADDSNAVVGALSFDVRTGAVTSFDTSQDILLHDARAFATITELGDKLLIAGGQEPRLGLTDEELDLHATAELFDPASDTLLGEPIALRHARTRHAAVTLQTGATLLLGGRSKVGEKSLDQVPAELIAPDTLRTKPTVLTGPRIDPQALLLSDGRVFLGGGTTALGEPTYPAGEWISSDGLKLLGESDIPARFERAFVATAGGGVLAVGGCESREPDDEDEAEQCGLECARGCRPLQPDGRKAFDAYWLDPEGSSREVSLESIVAGRPILLPGSDGRPWLVAEAEGEPGKPRLFRFDPWLERFDPADVPDDLRLPRPAYPRPISIDPDAFVWLDDNRKRGELVGMRLGTRNRYTQDLALVLRFDPDEPARPLHLVPDRPLVEPERYDGKLWLYPREVGPPLTVAVADADYGDVSISLRVAADSALPLLLLGSSVLGGEDCPWPDGEKSGEALEVPRVVRRGTTVELSLRGGTTTCGAPAGRLTLALQAGGEPSVIEELEIVRGATAF